jgi:hypothetical protein
MGAAGSKHAMQHPGLWAWLVIRRALWPGQSACLIPRLQVQAWVSKHKGRVPEEQQDADAAAQDAALARRQLDEPAEQDGVPAGAHRCVHALSMCAGCAVGWCARSAWPP